MTPAGTGHARLVLPVPRGTIDDDLRLPFRTNAGYSLAIPRC